MANLDLLCKELNNCGIPCSVVKNDERAWDELSFAGIAFERKSGNKPVELHEYKSVITSSECEIGNLYGMVSPFVRTVILEIPEKESEMAENISEVVERHAFNRGLKIKAPGTAL